MFRIKQRIERWGSGFSLIELLVAMAIFSIGVAGLSLILLASVRGTAGARDRTAAVMQASSLAELILLNPAALGHYIDSPAVTSDCLTGAPCGPAEWAAGNLARWHYELRQSLAEAEGLVCRDATPLDGELGNPSCDNSGPAVVKVLWVDSSLDSTPEADPQRVVMVIPE